MKSQKKWLKPALLALALSIYALPSGAQTPEKRGLAIAKAGKEADRGWTDMRARMQMTLRNPYGQKSLRIIEIKSLEVIGDGDKSMIVFNKPLDVKGTALLTYAHTLEPDEQWIYMPALNRVKRISSSNKSGPFMGSEFAFEDLSSFEVGKYTYKFLREEPCGHQLVCNVLEQYPTYKHSGYSKLISWIDQNERRIWKTEYYDRKGSLLKTLSYQGYQQYQSKHWRPDEMKMVNHQTSKQTDLMYDNYQFNTGLNGNDLRKNALKRAH